MQRCFAPPPTSVLFKSKQTGPDTRPKSWFENLSSERVHVKGAHIKFAAKTDCRYAQNLYDAHNFLTTCIAN